MGKVLATEISMFYYLFSFGKNKIPSENELTYTKKNGTKSILNVFLFLIETIILHLFVANWYNTIAWILTFLGIYTGLQILAILLSMSKRLISINYETQTLHLRYGFGAQTYIPFSNIEKINDSKKSDFDSPAHVYLSLFDIVDTPNLSLKLKEEHTLYKIYGLEKKFKSIALSIDQKDLFVEKLLEVLDKDCIEE